MAAAGLVEALAEAVDYFETHHRRLPNDYAQEPFVAAMLLAASDPEVPVSPELDQRLFHIVLRTYEAEGDWYPSWNTEEFGKILGHWLAHHDVKQSPERKLLKARAVVMYQQKGHTPLLLEIALDSAQPARDRAHALMGISHLGEEKDALALRPVLTDKTECGPEVGGNLTVGHVALATVLHLTREPLEDFGFLGTYHPESLCQTPSLHPCIRKDARDTAAARYLAQQQEQEGVDLEFAEFLADVDGRQGKVLPGWEKFRELVGESQGSRELFGEIHRHASDLVALYEKGGAEVVPALQQKLGKYQQHWNQKTNVGLEAAALYVGGDPAIPRSTEVDQLLVYLSLHHAELAPERKGIIEKLAVRWLNCERSEVASLCPLLPCASQYYPTEAPRIARKLLNRPPAEFRKQENIFPALFAITVLGDSGSERDLPLLMRCLELTDTRLGGISISDLALVGLIHLSGQQVHDYGFPKLAGRKFSAYWAELAQLDSREIFEEAQVKWRKWSQEKARKAAPAKS